MKMTREGLDLIKAHEGLRLEAYLCPAGVWTIGYGHTSAAGAPAVYKGMVIDLGEADKILRADLTKFEGYVRDALKVTLHPSQFSALVSFCFNVGPAAFRGSSVLKAVNSRRFDLVPSRLALWNKGDGKVLPGLVRRRADEAKLFMSGLHAPEVYPSTKVVPSPGKPIMASTTAMAGFGVGIAGATSTVAQIALNLATIRDSFGVEALLIGLGVLTVLGGAYIIYERIKKSKEDGV